MTKQKQYKLYEIIDNNGDVCSIGLTEYHAWDAFLQDRVSKFFSYFYYKDLGYSCRSKQLLEVK